MTDEPQNELPPMPTLPEVPPSHELPPLEEEEWDDTVQEEAVMAFLAKLMPLVISLLFHVGLFLVMFFLVFLVVNTKKADEIIVPSDVLSEDPGGKFSPQSSKTTSQSTSSARKVFTRKESVTTPSSGKTSKALNVTGISGGTSGAGGMGMGGASGGSAGAGLFGSGGNAFNVVYVIDRSGSMLNSFELVRDALYTSIGNLSEKQEFHVILFSDKRTPLEMEDRKLVSVSRKNRKKAFAFLRDVRPIGQTDPVPAIDSAFRVLKGARKRGQLMFLLTDGDFPDNAEVLAAIRSKNKDKKVHINTYLYGNKPPEAVKVMKEIAKENGGKYKFVKEEEEY